MKSSLSNQNFLANYLRKFTRTCSRPFKLFSRFFFQQFTFCVSNRYTWNSSHVCEKVGLQARNFSGTFSPNITKIPLKRSTALPYHLLRVFVQRRNETKRKTSSNAEPVTRSRQNNWQEIRPKTNTRTSTKNIIATFPNCQRGLPTKYPGLQQYRSWISLAFHRVQVHSIKPNCPVLTSRTKRMHKKNIKT